MREHAWMPDAAAPAAPLPLLVVRHVPWEGPHRILDAFAGVPVRGHDAFAPDGGPLPPVDGVRGALLMGGPMSVHDTAAHPWLAEEVRWLRDALAAGVPVLGVCLGAQLLAVAAGGRVGPGPAPEIGVAPVEVLGDDPLLGALAPSAPVLHWHGEVIELPAGVAPLARSAPTAVQAFRAGPRAWGTLFHAEGDAELVERWLAEPSMAAEARAALGDGAEARLRASAAALDPARGDALFRAFAHECAAHAARRDTTGDALRARLRALPVFDVDLPPFDPAGAPERPEELFAMWLLEAIDAGVHEPHAMDLGTVDADGRPSGRTLILKGIADGGWEFATDRTSRKGHELADRPWAAMTFHWREQGRQVRVRGRVLDAGAEAAARDHRARPTADPAEPVPEDWVVYRLLPDEVEFWQADRGRDHVRLHYRLDGGAWRRDRL